MRIVGLADAERNAKDLGTFWKHVEAGVVASVPGGAGDGAVAALLRDSRTQSSGELPTLHSVLREHLSKCAQGPEPHVVVVCGSVFLMDEALTFLESIEKTPDLLMLEAPLERK